LVRGRGEGEGWNQGLTSGGEIANIGAVSTAGEKFFNFRKEGFL
jgi:hypothetical protein